jgi:hypothetical protein
VKELSQRKAEVQIIWGINWLRSQYSVFVIGWHLVNFSLNLTTCSSLSLWNWTFQECLVGLSWPWKFAQLILAMGPTPHIVQLHLVAVVRGLLFLWEAGCFPCLFRCLLLKCLPHPKWSHLSHCSPYNAI